MDSKKDDGAFTMFQNYNPPLKRCSFPLVSQPSTSVVAWHPSMAGLCWSPPVRWLSNTLFHQHSLKLSSPTPARLSPSWLSSLIFSGARSSDSTWNPHSKEITVKMKEP